MAITTAAAEAPGRLARWRGQASGVARSAFVVAAVALVAEALTDGAAYSEALRHTAARVYAPFDSYLYGLSPNADAVRRRLLVVDLGQASLDRYRAVWPMSYAQHARILESIRRGRPPRCWWTSSSSRRARIRRSTGWSPRSVRWPATACRCSSPPAATPTAVGCARNWRSAARPALSHAFARSRSATNPRRSTAWRGAIPCAPRRSPTGCRRPRWRWPRRCSGGRWRSAQTRAPTPARTRSRPSRWASSGAAPRRSPDRPGAARPTMRARRTAPRTTIRPPTRTAGRRTGPTTCRCATCSDTSASASTGARSARCTTASRPRR
ncbi:MAG: hypothetical protein MZW92_24095 [Comamonadaceae bacterium]|nr:hypothetical protein [Comamonadaceae bacterium]